MRLHSTVIFLLAALAFLLAATIAPTNYYPNAYFQLCENDGAGYYGDRVAASKCEQYRTGYSGGEIHAWYRWKDRSGVWHLRERWHKSQYRGKAWVVYQPTKDRYLETFVYRKGGL